MCRILFMVLTVLAGLVASHAAKADWPPSFPDLSISLLPAGDTCLEGEACPINVRIGNDGTATVDAPLELQVKTKVPSVPGSAGEDWACSRQTFASFECRSVARSIVPGGYTDITLDVRMLPTPLEETEVCVSLDWRRTGKMLRASTLANSASVLGADAKQVTAPETIFGSWGEGDVFTGNDSQCVKIAIGPVLKPPDCPSGESLAGGRCLALASYCTDGRGFDASNKTCGCPAGQWFNRETRSCSSAVVACTAGRLAAGGLCFCPQATPVWNEKTSACEALPVATAAKPDEEAPEPSAPAATEVPEEPAVEQVPPRKIARIAPRRIVEEPRRRKEVRACPRGMIRTGGQCKPPRKPVASEARKQIDSASRFLPCPPGYQLGPLGRRCWSIETLQANAGPGGANRPNKWVCAAGLKRRGLICVSN
jgi:hypothetical protein